MIDRTPFFRSYASLRASATVPLTVNQTAALVALLDLLDADKRITLSPVKAYLLATVRHETAGTFRPITEFGAASYLAKYERAPLSLQLGNTEAGDGARYLGRGFVQITGRGNYAKFAAKLGVDLVGSPDLALKTEIAYDILVSGCLEGLFTGRSLGRYLSQTSTDYVGARAVVNGSDHASLIANYAGDFAGCLKTPVITDGVVNA